MKERSIRVIRGLAIFLVVTLVVLVAIEACLRSNNSPLKGSYKFGRVMIYPDRHVNFLDYMGTGAHEYAHYWMSYKSNKAFLLAWNSAVKKCGFESGYDFSTIKGKGLKIEEEFAECVREYWLHDTACCPEKLKVIRDFEVLA